MLKEVEIQAFYCETSTKFFSGVITASEFITLLCNHHTGRNMTDLSANILIQSALVEILTESLSAEEGSFISEYLRVRELCQQPTVPVKMALLQECVPVLALGPWIDSHVLKMESDLSLVTWSREQWSELIKVVYNPFSKYSFDTTPDRVRARVSHRLGAKVRSYFEDPLLLAAINSKREPHPFVRAGLVIAYRDIKDDPDLGEVPDTSDLGKPFRISQYLKVIRDQEEKEWSRRRKS